MEKQIQHCSMENIDRYGEIYAAAFSCEPWNDHWTVADATIHVRELLECKQSYGLEYLVDGKVAGFILGTSMLFSYGRTFELNDLAVAPEFQHQGIGKELLERCLKDLKDQGIKAVHLITACEGTLPAFYERYGFGRENFVMLMGREL